MIITKTPLRISFAGGGTDLQAFYGQEPGSVTSTAIDKYVYIAVHKYFHNKILLKYSQTELVDNVDEIKNERYRECLKLLGIRGGIEITSIADIPSGTGIGSSSSFIVGLLHALHAFKGEHVSAETLAKEACKVEIDILKNPIGKQDAYIAAYGGLKHIEFLPDETVKITPVLCKKEVVEKLHGNLMMFYTGIERSTNDILEEQKARTDEKRETLRNIKKLSEEIMECLISGNLDGFASALHEGWMEKRKVTDKISNSLIDNYYEKALAAGAKGGKLMGAGGGGFILLYCDKDKQQKVRETLNNLKELPFTLDTQGSRIIHVGD